MNKVEKLFIDKSVHRYGIYLYSKTVALEFIRECIKQNIPILGIDGFFISENKTQPSMEDSINFSSQVFTVDIYEKAILFINSRSNNLYFEIVCSDS